MDSNGKNYCLILAGGKGRRLWPSSRGTYPKQFIDFFGTGRTQLQQTFDRFAKILPKEHIYISTNQEYARLVQEQLPEVERDNILDEPIHRNTAPSVGWACYHISRICPEANIIVSPSDQAVFNEEAFDKNVFDGFEFVSHHDGLLTIGVKPTRPEPGYGYIQLGEPTDVDDLFRVKSFTEKPEHEFARMFMESGEFYWNTGMFLSSVRYLMECFKKVLPPVLCTDEDGNYMTPEEERACIRGNFALYPNLSVDYGILEKSEDAYVLKGDFGWADLGTWHSIYEAMSRGEDDNVVLDSEVLLENCRDNVIKLPKGRIGVFNGLDGYIVSEKDNVLLICKKSDSSSLIRKYVNEVQMKYGEEFI